jgi:outer membrane protein assembly factor BamB
MSRYNRTNETPPPAVVPAPIRYDTVDVAALQTITVLTGRNQLLSTNDVLASFSSAVGSSIVACLEVIPGLSDLANNLASVSTVAEGLPADAEAARTIQLDQSSTVRGWSSVIGIQTGAISTFANLDAYITAEVSTLTNIQSTTVSQISGIRDIIIGTDISTISTMIASTTITFQEISTTVTYINALTSSLVFVAIGQSASISTLSAGAVLLASTKTTAADFIGLSTAVAAASTSLGQVGEGSTANTRLMIDLSTTLVNLSSAAVAGASAVEFAGLSTQVGTASTGLGHIGASYSSTAINLSTLSAAVQAISTVAAAGAVSAAAFEGLSTAVLANSSAIGQIWPAVCSVTVSLSSLSTTVQGLSTSIGTVSGYATLAAYEGLSTYVLVQSSVIDSVNASLCSFVANISSLSSSAALVSTNFGNTSQYVGIVDFQWLSTYVLDQSTTIRNVSDSLSGFVISLSSLSSSVASVSTSLSGFARWPEFYGLSTTVLGQSISITNISSAAAILIPMYSSISTVTTYMSTAVNTFGIGNSMLKYGPGNITNIGSTLAGGTSNNVSQAVEVAIGFGNRVLSGNGTAIGFCNAVTGVAATAIGSYAAPRVADALTIAGGYTTALNGAVVGGSPQTFMVNSFGRTTAAGTYAPLAYWANTAMSTNSNLALSVINDNYLMQSVSLDLQGYEGDGGGSAGGGFYRGAYQFLTYWDNTSARNIYICDGVTGATSTLSTTLTAAVATNRLNGTPTVTATVFANTITANSAGTYAVAVRSSSATATNWLARLTIGELATSELTLGVWPMDYYNSYQNARTKSVGPLSAFPTVVWGVGFNAVPFGGPALIDNSGNIYVTNNGKITKLSPDGTSNWTIQRGGVLLNGCLTYDKSIVYASGSQLLKFGSYESVSEPTLIWEVTNLNFSRTNPLTIQQAPLIEENNFADNNIFLYIRGSDIISGTRLNNIAKHIGINGGNVWVHEPPNNAILGNIAVGKCNFIYFATSNASLSAINKTTGSLSWTALSNLIGDGYLTPPVVGSDGTIYQHGSANIVYAVNGQTGATLWSYNSGLNTPNFKPLQNILVGQNIYITYQFITNTSSNGRIIVLNSNGVFQYSNTNNNLVGGSDTLLRRLTLDANETIYGAYSNGSVYFAINGSDLTTKWDFNLGFGAGSSGATTGGVSIDRSNRAYFGGINSNFYALQ